MGELRMPDLTGTWEEEVYESAMFDLMLSLEERGETIQGNLNFATDLFDRSTVERWIETFKCVISQITSIDDCRVGEFQLITDVERSKIEAFNSTQATFPESTLVHQLFEAQAKRTPGALALVHGDRSLTYAQLDADANRLASHMRAKGVH